MTLNPFKPTAGKTPPALIGRAHIIEEFAEGIENGPGSPNRLMRISGIRGMGKTVMLNEIAAYATNQGWAVIEETASQGFCQRVLAAAEKLASPSGRISRLTAGPSIAGISLGSVEIDRASLSLREALGAAIAKNGNGLLITLDEVQDANIDEIRALAVAVQHEIREDASIAFVFAGLPSMIDSIVNGKTLTFLRRAVPVDLGPVGRAEVAASLQTTFSSTGMDISPQLCDLLAEASSGYPFMIQLVGYHTWQAAQRTNSTTVDEQLAAQGMAIARERFDQTVIEPALQRLPASAIAYLLAMAEDANGVSESGEVAKRLGKTSQQTSTCRARLIREDVIQASGWGKVSFAIPYMSDYLKRHHDEIRAEIDA